MSMPTIPHEQHRPTMCETVIDLLKSIALEEVALSHLVNAESEKLQAFVGKYCDFPTHPSTHEIIKFNQSINQLIDSVLMKEFLLLRKLEKTIHLSEVTGCHSNKKHCHCEKKHKLIPCLGCPPICKCKECSKGMKD